MVRSDYEAVQQGVAGQQLDTSDADSEDEAAAVEAIREARQYDTENKTAAEEAEALLEKSLNGVRSISGRTGNDSGTHDARRAARKSKQRRRPEKAEPMYEMEEGGPRSSSAEGSENSIEVDLARLHEAQAGRKVTFQRRKGCDLW